MGKSVNRKIVITIDENTVGSYGQGSDGNQYAGVSWYRPNGRLSGNCAICGRRLGNRAWARGDERCCRRHFIVTVKRDVRS